MTRSQRWLEMWSYARVTLGLSQQEYFRLSPCQFSVLVDRSESNHKRVDEKQEFMLAQLTAVVANFSFRPRKIPFSAKEFMPSRNTEDRQPAKQKQRRRSRKVIAEEVKAIMGFFRGRKRS